MEWLGAVDAVLLVDVAGKFEEAFETETVGV